MNGSPAGTERTARRVASVLVLVSAVLVVGWIIAIVVSWNHIVSSHARLGYLIGDIGVVVPLSVTSAWGLLRGLSWTGTVLQFTLGALTYDAVHFAVYLAQERFLGLGAGVYGVLLAVVLLALGWIAVWGHRRTAHTGS